MLGAMLVINWFGIFIANGASLILGYLTGSVLVIRYGWYVLMIFWYWIYFDSYFYVIFMVIANFLFWFAMRHDLSTFGDLKKEDDLEVSEEAVSDFLLMGKGTGAFYRPIWTACPAEKALQVKLEFKGQAQLHIEGVPGSVVQLGNRSSLIKQTGFRIELGLIPGHVQQIFNLTE